MATSYKTPGVFIEEIPKFPPSIAAVETAIPAFIGYTAKAVKNGESLIGRPVKIGSLLDYTTYFGEGVTPAKIEVVTEGSSNNYAVSSVTIDSDNRFYTYDSVRLFYDNGGGDCYIVSAGLYDQTGGVEIGETDGDPMGLLTALAAVEKEDEPTILVFPDAVSMDEASFYSLQQAALMQCAKLQDRVCVLDLQENKADDLAEAVDNFRNAIGINALKYGMAYAPWLYTSYPREVDYNTLKENVYQTSAVPANKLDLKTLTSDIEANALVTALENAIADAATVQSKITALKGSSASMADAMKALVDAANNADDAGRQAALNTAITFVRDAVLDVFATWNTAGTYKSSLLNNDIQSYGKSPALWKGSAAGLIGLERNTDVIGLTGINDDDVKSGYSALGSSSWLGGAAGDVTKSGKDYNPNSELAPQQVRMVGLDLTTAFTSLINYINIIQSSAAAYKKAAQDALYERHPYISKWVLAVKRELSKVPPSGAIAGIYARVDESRGVWKAPANESLNNVTGPVYAVSADEQAGMNVDPTAGKSINIIRSFIGKGTLVWGARTLAGNDNEWRYVNVRRFFNMVEESAKKASEQFVFEPNDANTWVKVQGMIENFLTTMWRQGALQGAKPEHAFYVSVGLGKTMTALDILEGRMIVEIGMAVVRPAEFIILRFSHKMAES